MSRLRVRFYVQLEPLINRAGVIEGAKPVSVTQTPSRAKGLPIEIDLDIDSAWFEPVQVSTGVLTINSPVPSPAVVTPPPPATQPAPTTMYGKALAKAKGS